GKYTASAICSFAYNQKIAVVDTNISRVLRRYFALTSEKHVWEKGFEFLNEHNPREHNLALMDLGALLCTPTKPKCEICPLYIGCKGAKAPHLYTKKKSVVYENIELHLGLFVKEGKIALIRSTEGLYKNLLTLPTTIPNEQMYISSFHHSYTRYKIKVNLYRLTTLPSQQEFTMIPLESISTAPISSLTKKALTNLS
ncbi:MAG TPA: A/G-specific adenine glycosylase, partial [Epsilonproteobacteria bacterium]|nr:A/G-specific adenine glycosylase [Campylobacterota bacterium]